MKRINQILQWKNANSKLIYVFMGNNEIHNKISLSKVMFLKNDNLWK